YGVDVTYGSGAEMAFDYLRDRMVLGAKTGDIHLMLDRLRGPHGRAGKLIMRGLGFAVIDDADGVLLDQARAPQAISGASATGDERGTAIRAFAVADGLEREVHFTLDADQPRIDISDRGKARIQELIERDNDRRDGPPLRRETVREALMARHLFFRDRHYVVRDGRVFILDDHSGEITADRQWAGGLQQLIEVKEGCEPSGRRVTLARMSYQSFFRRYQRLGGLSGVAAEGAAEFWSTYRMAVIAIPAVRAGPCHRMPDRVFATADEKLAAIAARVVHMAGQDRPVHIAAPTDAAAAAVAERLADMGIPFADISHDDGRGGYDRVEAVTLSAAMAGLDAASRPVSQGGLHVIIAEPHDSRRADRWLAQRCTGGDTAGSHERFLSLEDGILADTGGVMVMLARWFMPWAPLMGRAFTAAAARDAQAMNERNQTKLRRELLMYDRETSRMLAFAGRGE
ncbi:MAG: prepilin peptidase, partial [Proteobacteria bacterium]|nr:prepilin peptidase [Pseudomonadota bacterium]